MDVKAILLLGVPGTTSNGNSGPEAIAGIPIALLDVLGEPVLHRIADHLKRYGISDITVVGDTSDIPGAPARMAARADLKWVEAKGAEVWRTTESVFSDYAHHGADLVLVQRIGPYLEIDLDALIQFHLDQRSRVTAVEDEHGPLDLFVISASRRNDAAFLLRHQLQTFRTPGAVFMASGYINRLRDPTELRALARDTLLMKTKVRPAGREVRPGIWVVDGARIHPRARLVAPVFIGKGARVRAAAVVTRCTTLEHHAHVDCGTVIEEATVLPHTCIGAGLELAHSVAGFRRIFHLRRNAEVEIGDPKLVSMTSIHAPVRALSSAASLASFLPLQFFRGMFASRRRPSATLPATANVPSPALEAGVNPHPSRSGDPEVAKFPANLMVARRYGNQ